MNQEVKRKWVAALRSGKYKQGRGQLRSNDDYCCLGVLCDLHAQEKGLLWQIYRGSSNVSAQKNYSYLEKNSILPEKVYEWAELCTSDPNYTLDCTLGELNDAGKAFTEIADIIEEFI